MLSYPSFLSYLFGYGLHTGPAAAPTRPLPCQNRDTSDIYRAIRGRRVWVEVQERPDAVEKLLSLLNADIFR